MLHDDLIRSEFLDSIRASVRDYPLNGGDIEIMESIDRIVKEKTIRIIELENILEELIEAMHNGVISRIIYQRAEDVLRRRNDSKS